MGQKTDPDSESANSEGDEIYDITVVGGGPTGLFATFYAGLREMKTKVIEALPEVGGQVAVLYPEKYIYDVPGLPKILAKDLVKSLHEQALQFAPTMALDERVHSLHQRADRILELKTNNATHLSKTVLICAGVGAFSPNKLEAPGAGRFEGNGVHYHIRDKSRLRNKRIIVVGGGDSAVDWVLNLKDWASKITLVHRRDVFRAHEGSVAALFASGVEIKLFWEIKEVRGEDHVEGAVIFNNKTKEEIFIPADTILINIGFKADLGPIAEWGLELEGKAIRVNGKMETNIPGVYAAGDIAAPTDSIKMNLIATGFAHAAIAVNCAKNYIDPAAKVFPGHSSERRL